MSDDLPVWFGATTPLTHPSRAVKSMTFAGPNAYMLSNSSRTMRNFPPDAWAAGSAQRSRWSASTPSVFSSPARRSRMISSCAARVRDASCAPTRAARSAVSSVAAAAAAGGAPARGRGRTARGRIP